MKQIVIFASGGGTNAENLILYFQKNPIAEVVLVLTNNPQAQVIERCKRLGVNAVAFDRSQMDQDGSVLDMLKELQPDLIVLAGFLWKFPESILKAFPQKVINIHPALLPKYGGKGMYGQYVHQAVINNKETETGITIHYVNENYDEGAVIFQEKCNVEYTDKLEDVARKIHELEMKHFPLVVERLLLAEDSIAPNL